MKKILAIIILVWMGLSSHGQNFHFSDTTGLRSFFNNMIITGGTELSSVVIGQLIHDFNPKTYYVSNTGSDAANGLTPATAWQTIAKVNSLTFTPGTIIRFKCNDTWREQLIIPSSGNDPHYITFTSYGEGAKPKILGSIEITSWTLSHGNVWYSYNAAYVDPYNISANIGDANIWFKETSGSISWGRVKKATWVNLAVEYDWAWTLDTLYIYSPTDPNSRYDGVEMAQRANGILLNEAEYITIDGLEIAYAQGGIDETYNDPIINLDGLTIKNCHIHHFGIKGNGRGVDLEHSDMLIQNTIFHDAGRRNISIVPPEDGAIIHDIIIEGCTLYHGFHTTGIDLLPQGTSTLDNIIIRNNFIYDDVTEALDGVESILSAGIQAIEEGTGTITNLYIYNNIIKNLTMVGIDVQKAASVYIYNNTIYGVNPNETHGYALVRLGDIDYGEIKNNIFYNNADHTVNSGFDALRVAATATTIISDYNLFWSVDEDSRIIYWGAQGYYRSGDAHDWATYKTELSQDANSPIPADPTFETGSSIKLQSASTAIDAGTSLINIPNEDYFGNIRKGSFDIGAFEYNAE